VPHPGRIELRIGAPLEFPASVTSAPPGKARQLIAEQVMGAIKELSGQEYVHMYASDRKAELAAAEPPKHKPPTANLRPASPPPASLTPTPPSAPPEVPPT
jgi:hypothetical protein